MKQPLHKIRICKVCQEYLPLVRQPVVQLGALSKVMIAGQAPRSESGRSRGEKNLRSWLGVDETTFHDHPVYSIMPIGFCSPAKENPVTSPLRIECTPLRHDKILAQIKTLPLLLLIGQYGRHYYLKRDCKSSLTPTQINFKQYLQQYFLLPHPSLRIQNRVKINPWFMEEVIPELQKRIKALNPELLREPVPILNDATAPYTASG